MRRRLVAASLILLASVPVWAEGGRVPSSRDDAVEIGLDLLESGKNDAARSLLEGAARAGDARATGLLATIYFNGDGVTRDEALAYALTARAAAADVPAARAQLDMLHGHLSLATIAAAPARLRQWDGAPPPALSSPAAASDPQPAVAIAPAGAWQAQIGFFRSERAARAGWSALSRRMELAADRQPILVPVSAGTRLRLAATSRAEADALCRRANQAALACFVIAPAKG
jgi:hypothetical protein